MSKDERIYELEREIYYLECKDHWSSKDYAHMSKLRAELRKLKAED
jgi:hypothetical protein